MDGELVEVDGGLLEGLLDFDYLRSRFSGVFFARVQRSLLLFEVVEVRASKDLVVQSLFLRRN